MEDGLFRIPSPLIRAPHGQNVKADTKWSSCFQGGELELISDKKVDSHPKAIEFFHHNLLPLKQISCSGFHCFALLQDGRVYQWSSTKQNPELIEFSDLQKMETIVQISTGGSHTLFLTSVGRVLALGASDRGQCGISIEGNLSSPKLVPDLHEISQIAAGESFSLVVSRNGEVWGMGNNDCYQLASEERQFVAKPIRIEGIRDVELIECGSYHAFAKTRDGKLYAWGDNEHFQLGLGETSRNNRFVKMPTLIPFSRRIRQISTATKHSLLLTEDNRVYFWGTGLLPEPKKLKASHTISHIYEPQLIEYFENQKVVSIAASLSNSFVVTDEEKVYGWGKDFSVRPKMVIENITTVSTSFQRDFWIFYSPIRGPSLTFLLPEN